MTVLKRPGWRSRVLPGHGSWKAKCPHAQDSGLCVQPSRYAPVALCCDFLTVYHLGGGGAHSGAFVGTNQVPRHPVTHGPAVASIRLRIREPLPPTRTLTAHPHTSCPLPKWCGRSLGGGGGQRGHEPGSAIPSSVTQGKWLNFSVLRFPLP